MLFLQVGAPEMLLILVVMLIAVGPEQLPGVIRKVGRAVAQARSMTDGLRSEFMNGMDELERSTNPTKWNSDGLDPMPISHDVADEDEDPPASDSEPPDLADEEQSDGDEPATDEATTDSDGEA